MKKLGRRIKKIINDENILTWIIIILSAILVGSLFINPIKAGGETYTGEIIIIDGCEDCFNMEQVIDLFEGQSKLDIKSTKNLDYKTEEAKDLIEKYQIEKIPTLILKSKDASKIIKEIKGYEEIFSLEKNYLVFEKAAPYFDLESDSMKGVVNFIEIQDTLCEGCGTFSSLLSNLETAGLKKGNYEIIHSSSERGKNLIAENGIKFLPSLLIDKEINEYWWILDAIGSNIEDKGENYFVNSPVYPYRDLVSGEIKGKVEVIYLINQSCEDCFDPAGLGENFKSMGVYFNSEKEIDISSLEGMELKTKYDITLIPTIILSPAISDYDGMDDLLGSAGTFEEDDSFVFRAIDQLNAVYQTLN